MLSKATKNIKNAISLIITHADGSHVSKAIIRVCVSVCDSVCLSVCLSVRTIKPKRLKLQITVI